MRVVRKYSTIVLVVCKDGLTAATSLGLLLNQTTDSRPQSPPHHSRSGTLETMIILRSCMVNVAWSPD